MNGATGLVSVGGIKKKLFLGPLGPILGFASDLPP